MYKLQFHPTLAARWQNFSSTEQILMIGNEFNRALNALKERDYKNVKDAFERAFELIDLAISFSSHGRQKELLRLRELLAGFYCNFQQFSEADLKQLTRVLLSFDRQAFDMLSEQYV